MKQFALFKIPFGVTPWHTSEGNGLSSQHESRFHCVVGNNAPSPSLPRP